MEKPAKFSPRATPRQTAQPCPAPHSPSSYLKDIRRQLGWGLVEQARKGVLR